MQAVLFSGKKVQERRFGSGTNYYVRLAYKIHINNTNKQSVGREDVGTGFPLKTRTVYKRLKSIKVDFYIYA